MQSTTRRTVHMSVSIYSLPNARLIPRRGESEHMGEEMDRVEEAVAEVREAYESGRTRSLSWRRSQLKALQRLLYEREEDIFAALKEDLRKCRAESYRDEVGVLIKSVNFALENLKRWMAPCKALIPLVGFPSSGELVAEPLGIVLILSSWNFPIGLSLEPLIGALSAGNAVVLKPSELAPSTSEFLKSTLPKYLDNKFVKVIAGDPVVGQKLLDQKWDKIFFTGSPSVARIVMAAAAKNLTPVTLELGGKCPAIFDSLTGTRNRKVAARRVAGGKWVPCSGQACISVDYVLVEEDFAPTLVELLKSTIKKFDLTRDCLCKIVNEKHFQRLSKLLEDPSVAQTIVHGGSLNSNDLFIEPTILLNPPLDAKIMNEEIFGPLLPIITVKKIEDSIEFLRARPKPLVIYAFTHNEKLKSRIVAETSSGSLTFNDTMIQFACDALPFGGVGASGFGQYHGKFSFDLFSHKKAVLRRSFLLEFSFRYPPWTDWKLPFLRDGYHFNYLYMLLRLLGLKR